ncbi:MAG: tetratricopeptide repeat protein [Proteobacteria bacterium]|nr:tetratricopeptide repeat protein [Pseudomonadota bacterium]
MKETKMWNRRDARLLLGALCLALGLAFLPAQATARHSAWKAYMADGAQAYRQGDYAEAEKQLTAALEKAEKFALKDLRLAASLNNLAELYWTQGRYGEAEPLFKRALESGEGAMGPEHPARAMTLNNLAELYRVQGRHAEAEPLYRRALAIREKALGPDHPDVATSLVNYAALLRETGRGAEAEKLEARAEAIKAKHGEENP